MRDPYVFEFVGLEPKEKVDESNLEEAILSAPFAGTVTVRTALSLSAIAIVSVPEMHPAALAVIVTVRWRSRTASST